MFGSLIIHSNPWHLFDKKSGRRKYSHSPGGHRAHIYDDMPCGLDVNRLYYLALSVYIVWYLHGGKNPLARVFRIYPNEL